jgi:hypothetical protein
VESQSASISPTAATRAAGPMRRNGPADCTPGP